VKRADNTSLVDLLSTNGPNNMKQRVKLLCLRHIHCYFSLHVQHNWLEFNHLE